MARKKDSPEANHLKAWREFRQMTQEQLGDAAGTTGSVISLLEAGDRKLSLKWLRKLAPALNTNVGHLAEHDPATLPTDILDIWASVPDAEKPRALDVLKAFRTGTGG